MFAKLATVIVVLGAMFGALLVNRQQRIDAAAEISRIHFRMLRHDRARTAMQAQVAAAVRPDRLRAKLAEASPTRGDDGQAGGFKPIPFRSKPERATDEALGPLEQLASEDEQRDAARELGG
ncbi:MAG: hypothetical protein GC172_12990 [Phycisphaera sp.]|nr:hypothetical protein [Phycisphaera sp.]